MNMETGRLWTHRHKTAHERMLKAAEDSYFMTETGPSID